jgi:hypothetical protein
VHQQRREQRAPVRRTETEHVAGRAHRSERTQDEELHVSGWAGGYDEVARSTAHETPVSPPPGPAATLPWSSCCTRGSVLPVHERVMGAVETPGEHQLLALLAGAARLVGREGGGVVRVGEDPHAVTPPGPGEVNEGCDEC